VEVETVTEAAQPSPVPGPPRPSPGPTGPDAATVPDAAPPFADLGDRPVADHVAVYEAEHERLQRQLSTVDQL
jgi:hypothetical protein